MSQAHCSDGPEDATTDVSHLSDTEKRARLNCYTRWYKRGGRITTAAGKTLLFDLQCDGNVKAGQLRWKVDGQVSIAKEACQICKEINTLRPKRTPPFVCLVRARDAHLRADGTTVCAYCSCQGATSKCRAQAGPLVSGGLRETSEETCTTEKDNSSEDSTPVARKKTRISYLCEDRSSDGDSASVSVRQRNRNGRSVEGPVIEISSSPSTQIKAYILRSSHSSEQASNRSAAGDDNGGSVEPRASSDVEVAKGREMSGDIEVVAMSTLEEAGAGETIRVNQDTWTEMQASIRSLSDMCEHLSARQEEMQGQIDEMKSNRTPPAESLATSDHLKLKINSNEEVIAAVEAVLASQKDLLELKKARLDLLQASQSRSAGETFE